MRYHTITLPLYHFTIWKCITLPLYIDKVYPVPSVCRLSIAILTALIAPYSHEKPLYGILYHNKRKPLKIALKRVTRLCPFYRTQKLFYIISIVSCRCAFYAVCLPYLQVIFYLLVYSYTNGINTLKTANTCIIAM